MDYIGVSYYNFVSVKYLLIRLLISMSQTSVTDRLEQWDSELASLSIVQTNSIVDISRLVAERLLPTNLIEEYSNRFILESMHNSHPTLGADLNIHAFKDGDGAGTF